MICGIYAITALVPGGASFWGRGIFSLTGLESSDWAASLGLAKWNIKANEAFLTFGALGLCANIVASYGNVRHARRSRGQSAVTPLLGLLPLVLQQVTMTVWALGNDGQILRDGATFVAFCCAWGIAFAYSVGLLIVAHVTKAPFPYWNGATLYALLGAIDAWLSK
jgi:ethanolaminephosphotransferase